MIQSPMIKRSLGQSRSCRSSLGSMREIDGEYWAAAEEEEGDVYVALDKDFTSGMHNFLWVVRNISRGKKIIIVHVHNPADRINIMGGWFPAQKVNEEQVAARRDDERKKIYQCLEQYINLCTRPAEILVIEKDDVGRGLVELIAERGITKLVMGAAADKYFSRRMTVPRSRAAVFVQQHADPSCKVWFVCKGNLICTRDVAHNFTDQEGHQFQHQSKDLGEDGPYDEIFDKLRILEAEFGESPSNQRAKKELNETIQKVTVAESLYTEAVKRRKEIEEMLEEERSRLRSLEKEHENLATEKEYLRQKIADMCTSSSTGDKLLEFSLAEVQQATDGFHESRKIGEGGYGNVYKGNILRHTVVAIKRLNPESTQGAFEFNQEINVLSKVRHPNLVTLIGACPEARALIYEYLPNGSLEDRLACKGNTSPLTWQERTRIAAEICSTLLFIHSCKPLAVVHGDLKPANILLDTNLVSKLGDFGICHLLAQPINATTLYTFTRQPKGTFAYMSPELLLYGEMTTRSDVYSFGVILLQLLTGKPAFRISQLVQTKLETGCLEEVLDPTAEDWPYAQAKQLALLGLRCCEVNRKDRLDANEAWKILEPLANIGPSSSPLRFSFDDDSCLSSPTSSIHYAR